MDDRMYSQKQHAVSDDQTL